MFSAHPWLTNCYSLLRLIVILLGSNVFCRNFVAKDTSSVRKLDTSFFFVDFNAGEWHEHFGSEQSDWQEKEI